MNAPKKGILDMEMGGSPMAGPSPSEDEYDPLEAHLETFKSALDGGDMAAAKEAFKAAVRSCKGGSEKGEY